MRLHHFKSVAVAGAICILGATAFSSNVSAFPRHETPRYQNASDDMRPFYPNGIYDPTIPVPKDRIARGADARPIRIYQLHDSIT